MIIFYLHTEKGGTSTMLRLIKDEAGQGMVEYGLILALVAIAAIAALTLLGGNVKNMFNTVNNTLTGIKVTN